MSEKGSNDDFKMSPTDSESTSKVARLCYVDDSKTSAFVVRRVLEPLGYHVDHFATAEPAFVALIQKDYDLLLTDLKVSSTGMDGDELIRTVRQSGHPKISAMPIIVITGATDAEVLLKVYNAGANQVMNKPVDGVELDSHIRRLLFDSRRTSHASEAPKTTATVVPITASKRATPKSDTKSSIPSPATAEEKAQDIPVLRTVEPTQETPKPPPLVKPSIAPQAAADDTRGQRTEQVTSAVPEESTIERVMKPNTADARQADADKDEDFDDDDEVVIIDPEESANKRRRSQPLALQQVDANILYEMEKYSLVHGRRNGMFNMSGLVSGLHSLLEYLGMQRLLLRAALLVFLIVIGTGIWSIFFDKGVPVKTAVVETGEIFQSITVPGRVVSKHRLNVSPSQSGRLIKILAKEGDKVEKGQLLAQLDDRELSGRLTRARANLADAREGIVLAERTLERMRKANSKGAVAARFVEDAEVELRGARARVGVAVEEVRSVTLELDNHIISAPFSGTVITRSAEVGQWISPADALFTLVDESQREIEVWVDAADSVAIEVGQLVDVSSDAFPDLQWQETVTRLGTATDSQHNANSVKVYVSLGGNAPGLRIGQQVDADIRTAWNPNALSVPFGALLNRDGQTMVAVLEEGELRLRPVTVGIEDFTKAEITQGLSEGEEVILVKGQDLQDGDKVYPVSSGE
jgi:RND family efflux transporter MFP subunit